MWILPKNKINYSAQKRKQQSHLRYLKFGSLVNSRLTSNYQLQRRLSKEHPSHVWFYIVQLYGFRRLKLKITSSQNGRPSWFSHIRQYTNSDKKSEVRSWINVRENRRNNPETRATLDMRHRKKVNKATITTINTKHLRC